MQRELKLKKTLQYVLSSLSVELNESQYECNKHFAGLRASNILLDKHLFSRFIMGAILELVIDARDSRAVSVNDENFEKFSDFMMNCTQELGEKWYEELMSSYAELGSAYFNESK